MRFYETSDVDFFVNIRNGWDSYCRYGPDKSWAAKSSSKTSQVKLIKYYQDFEGKLKDRIEDKDLYFERWPQSRREPNACLPVYFSLGNRFIKLEKEKPLGYKCKLFPMNLAELQEKKRRMKEERRARKHRKWLAKMLLAECQKKKDIHL